LTCATSLTIVVTRLVSLSNSSNSWGFNFPSENLSGDHARARARPKHGVHDRGYFRRPCKREQCGLHVHLPSTCSVASVICAPRFSFFPLECPCIWAPIRTAVCAVGRFAEKSHGFLPNSTRSLTSVPWLGTSGRPGRSFPIEPCRDAGRAVLAALNESILPKVLAKCLISCRDPTSPILWFLYPTTRTQKCEVMRGSL
jgi:hypothetical protein